MQGVPELGFQELTQIPGGHGNLPAIPASEGHDREIFCLIVTKVQELDVTCPAEAVRE